MKLGEQFQKLAAGLTDFSPNPKSKIRNPKSAKPPHVVSYGPDWKQRIHEMRMRIEKERTPVGQDELAIKTGRGGLVDAEFIAQALCLEHGWHEPHTLRALERGRDAGVLPDAIALIANYRQLRRVEGILRRWSYEGETLLPDEPEPYYRVAVRCGFNTAEKFYAALAGWRQGVRNGYERVLPGQVR
jgi:glutamate-ammonia-ligase adenylyltransferase